MRFLNDYANGTSRNEQREKTRQELTDKIKKDIKLRIHMKKNVLHFIKAIEQSIEDDKTTEYQSQEIALEMETEKIEDLNFFKKLMRLL